MATTEDAAEEIEEIENYPTLGEENPLGKLYRKRVAQNRDLTVLVASWDLERGQGKTTLAMRLAAACDRTEDGITTDKAIGSAHGQIHTCGRDCISALVGQCQGIATLFPVPLCVRAGGLNLVAKPEDERPDNGGQNHRYRNHKYHTYDG